ncbi:hypothetical protein [Sorangium sp. So ce887]|uniref:hypothetical protein n=1 Tax=Sorangium sp. So ce887 TaxID=3133324 RepID=UPI003F622754
MAERGGEGVRGAEQRAKGSHIHFTVRLGGQEYLTSQLFFLEDLTAPIFAEHPDDKEFGQPVTRSRHSICAGPRTGETP